MQLEEAIDIAAAKVGGYNELSRRMELAKGNLSAMRHRRRATPLRVLFDIAAIAEIDAKELVWDEAKRAVGKTLTSAAVLSLGAVAMLFCGGRDGAAYAATTGNGLQPTHDNV